MAIFHRAIKILTRVLAAIFLSPVTSSFAANYSVIINKSNTEDAIARNELRSIFLGDKVKWKNNKYIKIAIPEDENILKEFLHSELGMTPSQFNNQWKKLVFTGKASMPQTFTEKSQIIEYLASNPGAIGVVTAGGINGSVKAITIK
jgi:ABC-type phosphate transport system substrate-binding protein